MKAGSISPSFPVLAIAVPLRCSALGSLQWVSEWDACFIWQTVSCCPLASLLQFSSHWWHSMPTVALISVWTFAVCSFTRFVFPSRTIHFSLFTTGESHWEIDKCFLPLSYVPSLSPSPPPLPFFPFFLFFLFVVLLGTKPRTLYMLGKHSASFIFLILLSTH